MGRFDAREGEVWDQTTVPAHRLDLDDARALVQTWAEKANQCRARSDYNQARCWSEPASALRAAITLAESQRRLGWAMQGRPPG
jgi:hypothetical protein